MSARLQMRVIYLGTDGSIEQYRYVAESNGWGGRWWNSVYDAWIDWRRLLRT